MEEDWEVEDELYTWKDSLWPMLVQQSSFPKLKECGVEGREEIWTNSPKPRG